MLICADKWCKRWRLRSCSKALSVTLGETVPLLPEELIRYEKERKKSVLSGNYSAEKTSTNHCHQTREGATNPNPSSRTPPSVPAVRSPPPPLSLLLCARAGLRGRGLDRDTDGRGSRGIGRRGGRRSCIFQILLVLSLRFQDRRPQL